MHETDVPKGKRARDASKIAERLQTEAASLLYSRLISPGGAATVGEVSDILKVAQSTVYRQCNGDIPVQLRTLAALASLDFEGFKGVLDLMGSELGVSWTWNPQVADVPEEQDAFQAVADVSLVCSEAAALEYGALRDGVITNEELEELENVWTREDFKKAQMRAQIRAMKR